MKNILSILVPVLLLGGACAGGEQPDESDTVWKAFEAAATRWVDGRKIYIVEWDHPIESIEALREYYLATHGLAEDSSYATTSSPLLVNTVNGIDDKWTAVEALTLTYCVSTTFGSDYARAINEMKVATADWATYANVLFTYDSSEDANCDGTNNNVTFAVAPWSSGGACAFFPSGPGCIPRTLVIDFDDLDTNPTWDTLAPNMTTTGVFRHELGHVLGFRHEHTSPLSNACFEDFNWRALTLYDPSSVMHYQWCNGVLTSDMTLTDFDIEGSVDLYGLAAGLTEAVQY